MRRHQRQPRRSMLCGQTCVAMALGVGVAQAIGFCGCGCRATTERDVRAGLAAGGRMLLPFVRWRERVLPRDLPEGAVALLRLRHEWRAYGYHWILMDGQRVYDPALPRPLPAAVYDRLLSVTQGYVTSWAVLL